MSNTREQLFREALANPEDDTVRLVYADCLEETGKRADVDRAAFIREQIAFHREPGNHNCKWPLLEQYAKKWVPSTLRAVYPFERVQGSTVWLDTLGGYVRFTRGFISEVGFELPWRRAILEAELPRTSKHLQDLFASNPLEHINVSFENDQRTLVADVGKWEKWLPPKVDTKGFGRIRSPEELYLLYSPDAELPKKPDVGSWRVMWSVETYMNWRHDHMESPVTEPTRAELGRQLAGWFSRAVMEPASAVAIDVDGRTMGYLTNSVNSGIWNDPDNPSMASEIADREELGEVADGEMTSSFEWLP